MSAAREFVAGVLDAVATALTTQTPLPTLSGDLEALVVEFEEATSPTAVDGIAKIDEDQRIVWGWASMANLNGQPVIDSQQDIIAVEDLQFAAHDFMRESRVGGQMHKVFGIGTVVDSIVLTKGLQDALGIDLGHESWLIGLHVTDDAAWARVKSGELREFSIGGTAVREPLAGA